jgi:hypothetical protein
VNVSDSEFKSTTVEVEDGDGFENGGLGMAIKIVISAVVVLLQFGLSGCVGGKEELVKPSRWFGSSIPRRIGYLSVPILLAPIPALSLQFRKA